MRLAALIRRFPIALLFLCTTLQVQGGEVGSTLTPSTRVLMDAHNCYPYDGKWSDRIERALKAGTPLAIEQDLLWYTDKHTGKSWSIVSHGGRASGKEPTMREYFFERIRPIMEEALRQGNHGDWPLVTLNLDFKSDEAVHHAAVLQLLNEYEDWICTAGRTADAHSVTPLTVKPLLVLTGEADSQERDFYESVPVGERLLVFGAVHVRAKAVFGPSKTICGSVNWLTTLTQRVCGFAFTHWTGFLIGIYGNMGGIKITTSGPWRKLNCGGRLPSMPA